MPRRTEAGIGEHIHDLSERPSPKVLSNFDIRFGPGITDRLVLEVSVMLIGRRSAEGMVQRDNHPPGRKIRGNDASGTCQPRR